VIPLYVFLINLFSRQKLRWIRVNQTYLMTHKNYDKVLFDYYEYIAVLLTDQMRYLDRRCLLVFELNKPMLLDPFIPILKVSLQIEHTLVKQGARDSDNGIPGYISISEHQDNYLVRIAKLENLLRSDLVIEYSKINEFNIKKVPELAAYIAKAICISPALYKIELPTLLPSFKRNINTITLFGNPDEGRRKKFLQSINNLGVPLDNICNHFDGIECLYRDTKIIVNIRQTDHHDTLEELRILPALRCGVIVISERAPLVHLTRYSKYVIWGELAELPRLIMDVQANYKYWQQKIFGNPGFLRRMNRISKRNHLVSLKAMRQLNGRI